MSLPQITSQMIAPINRMTMVRIILVMILRFLEIGFLDFFMGFLDGLVDSSVALSSPVCSSKLKV